MKLIVYTAITGGWGGILRSPANSVDQHGRDVEFICFSDCIHQAPAPWKIHPPLWGHENPRRVARYHKVLAHRVLPDAEFWLWHDGTQQLKCNPWSLVDRYLVGSSIASYKHPDRDCVYQEHKACLRFQKDSPTIMAEQVSRYRTEGYPEHNGMVESTVMLRANTESVHEINESWWGEIRDGSLRDQLSFNYVMWRLKRTYGVIAGSRNRPVYFNYTPHLSRNSR